MRATRCLPDDDGVGEADIFALAAAVAASPEKGVPPSLPAAAAATQALKKMMINCK